MTYFHLLKTYKRYLMYGVVHAFFSSVGQTFLVSLFLPNIQSHFGLAPTKMFFLYAFLATFIAASFLPFVGRQIDHMNLKNYSYLTGILLTSATIIIAMAPNIPILVIGFICLRLAGQSLMSHIASTSMARYFGPYRGKALAISSIGHPIGEAFLPIIVIQLIMFLGWQTTFIFLGGTILIVFFPLVIILLKHDDPFTHPGVVHHEEEKSDETDHWTWKEVLKTPFFYFVLPQAVLPAFLATGLFLSNSHIAEINGWTMQWIAISFMGFAVCRVIGAFFVGLLIDRFSARAIFPFHLFPLVLGLIVLAKFSHPFVTILYFSLIGLGIGASPSLGSALWAETYGTKHLGEVRSLSSTLIIYSTTLSVVFGYYIEKGWDFNIFLMGLAAVTVGASVLSFFAPAVKKRP